MRSKHQKNEYVLIDEGNDGCAEGPAVFRGAHARVAPSEAIEVEGQDGTGAVKEAKTEAEAETTSLSNAASASADTAQTPFGKEASVYAGDPADGGASRKLESSADAEGSGDIEGSTDAEEPNSFGTEDAADVEDSTDAEYPDASGEMTEEGYDAAENMTDDVFDERDFSSSDEEGEREGSPSARKRLKIAGIVAGIVVAIVALVYIAGAIFFSSHFLPHTVINGVDVSLKAPQEVSDQLSATLENYQLVISGNDYELTIVGEDIAYGVDHEQDMLASFNQWAWPVEIAKGAGAQAALGVSYDDQVLEQILTESLDAYNEEASDPIDAHLAYDDQTNTIVIAPETKGTKLDEKKIAADVKNALSLASPRLELGEGDLVAPAVLSTDEILTRAASQVNALSDVSVTMTLGGYPAIKVNKGNLLDWIIYDENHNVFLNEEAVAQWADQMANKLNTYGTEHSYTRPDGKEITVNGSTAFGWSIDVEALKDDIVAAVREGTIGEVAIPCEHEGAYYNMETGAEWSRFIDIDLGEQHAYFFDEQGDILWESDIVSGNVNYASRNTPLGIFSITRMARNEKLRTYEEGKEEPNETIVAYWMPFVGNVYALHDAWWQPAFGGTRYRDGYGSHGCVNLPSDKAAELYSILEVGTVVVVHW